MSTRSLPFVQSNEQAIEFVDPDGLVMLRLLPDGSIQLEDGSISPNNKQSMLAFRDWLQATRGSQ